MLAILETIGLAAVMFAATNADDLVLLGVLFARPGVSPRHIVIGQLLGIAALMAASLAMSQAVLNTLHGYIRWFGIVPVLIGIHWFRHRNDPPDRHNQVASNWWNVAALTMANGADNLGVYTPHFALQTKSQIALIAGTFLLLTLIWCWMARMAASWPARYLPVARLLKQAAPWVLIGMGAWIMVSPSTF